MDITQVRFKQNIWPLLFVIVGAIYFWDVLSAKYLLVERDLLAFFIPPREFWVNEVKNFSFPFWNPYYYSGAPLFANLQPGVLYPFSIFYLFFPFHVVFNYTIVLHFILAGIFTFALMRAQKASVGAAMVSGFSFMLSGYLLSVHNLLSTLLSVAWVPLFLLVYFTAFYKKDLLYSILAGIIGCVMFLGGGVEVCYITFGMVFVLSLIPGLLFDAHQYPDLKTRLLSILVFFVVFLGLSAVQLIPFMEVSSHSIRSGGLSYGEATVWSLHPVDLLEFFVPDIYGLGTDFTKYWGNQNWLKTIYMGSMVFILSGFFVMRKDKKSLAFVLLFLFSVALALGKYTWFNPYIYEYAPFFSKLRYPVKFIFWAVLIISITAGYGFDHYKEMLSKNPESALKSARVILAFGCLAMLALGALSVNEESVLRFAHQMKWDDPKYNDIQTNLSNLKRFLGFTGIFCLLIFMGARAPRLRSFFLAGIVFILVTDLFFANFRFYEKIENETINANSSNLEFFISDPNLFRVFTTEATRDYDGEIVKKANDVAWALLKDRLEAGFGLSRHIFYASGVEVLRLGTYEHFYSLLSTMPMSVGINLLSMMNIKYVISIPPLDSPDLKLVHANVPIPENVKEFETQTNIKVYENLKVLPRSFLVPDCRVVRSDEAYKTVLSDRSFSSLKKVLLDEEPPGFPCGNQEIPTEENIGWVSIIDYKSNSIDLSARINTKSFLFLSESYYPDWEAFVGGKPAKIYRANYAFRAIVLDPGTHHIRFQYSPRSFWLGLSITILTVLILGVTLLKRTQTIRSKSHV